MTIGTYELTPQMAFTIAALVVVLMLLAFLLDAIWRDLARLFLPAHERLIMHYRMPADEALAFRRRLFADEARHQQALQRWQATCQRVDRIARDVVALAHELDRRRAQMKIADGATRAACDALFEQLKRDLASASWIPEEWDEKVRAMERVVQTMRPSAPQEPLGKEGRR